MISRIKKFFKDRNNRLERERKEYQDAINKDAERVRKAWANWNPTFPTRKARYDVNGNMIDDSYIPGCIW